MSTKIGQTLTVREAVTKVKQDQLLLPGIQRNFVWKTGQIYALFDSLMRGYPVGSLLLWKTRPKDHPHLSFRRLITDYNGKNTPLKVAHPQKASLVHAVLDGQQRLTALNIGLRGTHSGSEKAPNRALFIDLDHEEPDAGSENNQYRFEFRKNGASEDSAWFQVSDAPGLATDASSLSNALLGAGLKPDASRRRVLKTLVRALDEPALRVDIESGRDLDRVLNVFARANMGGTSLTYVELLVSTATARWRHLNAAKEIDDLRRSINDATPEKFRFTADRIVKAGLVVLGGNTKFHVESFTTGNKARQLEDMWPEFERSMKVAAGMLAEFGLSNRSLAAQNVIIPLAYYAHHRHLKPSYATAHSHEKDRNLVRAFVARTLLQRRYWTGDVDAVLRTTRSAVKSAGSTAFPLDLIEEALRNIKPIAVTDELLDELCELRYGDRRTLPLLRMLFPHMVHNGAGVPRLDKDHIFPTSSISPHQLGLAGIPAGDLNRFRDRADSLPNLQLLSAEDNRGGKSAKEPKKWMQSLGPTAKQRYRDQDVKYLPADLAGFDAFWLKRRENLRSRIAILLEP